MNELTVTLNDMNDSGIGSVTFGSDDRQFVYAVARRIVGSPDEAEDVTQDALLLAYRHRDTFRGDARYRTWLYRIAATTALGHLRRQRRSRLVLVEDPNTQQAFEQRADATRSAPAQLEEAEERAVVQRAIGELAPPYRDVLLARAEASESEVARRLGLSIANVKVRAHRARKLLRTTIERERSAA